MSAWTEHRNPEGRTYWFSATTRESVWEKPDDLKTPFERALSQTKWKEYFSGGRKYYYNTETKDSKWDMPDELLLLLEKVEKETKDSTATPPAPATPALIAPGPGFTPIPQMQGALVPMGGADPSLTANAQADNAALANGLPLTSGILPARPNLPEDPVIPHNGFATVEEGEKAFVHLLRKAGVDANWTWDQTMRTIITDPLYKALNTLAEKKNAWQKYTDSLKAKEQEERDARLSKLRPALRNMLKGNPNVFHYTTFATADRLFGQHPTWQQGKIEAERKLIFEEYVEELKQREMQEARTARSRAIATTVEIFKQMDVDVLTRWRQAHSMLLDSEEWNSNVDLRNLPTLDILLAFEDYSRVREREFEEQMRRQQLEKTRRERKAREGFKQLLAELIDSGVLTARTKWKQIYPTIRDDERYTNMLGNPGSNPLELFWDAVDELDQKLDAKIAVVDAAFDAHAQGQQESEEGSVAFAVSADTNEDEFMAALRATGDQTALGLEETELRLIFNTKLEEAQKKQDEERRRAERKMRHLQEDFRYALKKLPEPIDINMSYEDALPLMEPLAEFTTLDDENRRAAFAKFIKKQKERLREASEDGASATSRKRKEPHREREDYDRERRASHNRQDDGYNRSRDYDKDYSRDRERDRDYRDRDRDRDRDRYRDKDYGRERDRDYGSHRSKHHRDYDRDHRDHERDRGDRRRERKKDWDDGRYPREKDRERSSDARDRERSASVSMKDRQDSVQRDERAEDRADKRARYEQSPKTEGNGVKVERDETPEEGEI